MKEILSWLNEALAGKDIVIGMTYYHVQNNEIRATNGRLTASHPWPFDGEFLVPGEEFEKVLRHMPETPTIKSVDGGMRLKCGRIHSLIHTLPADAWNYPGVDEAMWQPIPEGLFGLLKDLRLFISDNAVQRWALCVALQDGWVYATNNVAIAGAPCKKLDGMQALLPNWAIDFVLPRLEGLAEWAWSDSYVAFRWDNGAWMRSQLEVGVFPEQAAGMVKKAFTEEPTQIISEEFREAFNEVAELAEDTIEIYANKLQSKFGRAQILGEATCEVPEGAKCSIWGAKYLAPVIANATCWSPAQWPKPVSFKGERLAGYIVGRKM